MKRNRIGMDRICYIFDQNDLAEYNLTLRDLTYGNEKTKALLNGLIEHLSKEVDFNPENSNLSVELVPLENGELKIEVCNFDLHEEANILFSNVLKEQDDADYNLEHSLEYSLKEEMQHLPPLILANVQEKEDADSHFIRAFEMKKLDDIIQLSHIIQPNPSILSSLYKDKTYSKYILLLECLQTGSNIKEICNLIIENGGKSNHHYTVKSYCEEHLDLIIKDVALEQLSRI